MSLEFPNLNADYVQLLDRVYDVLRDYIIRGLLAPGQQLSVPALAARLGVSRTPVRDALNRLGGQGLVEIRPRKGTFVARVSREDLQHILDVRLALELHAARRAVERARAADVEALRSLLDAMRSLTTEEGSVDYRLFTDLDGEFHVRFVQAAANPRLLETYRALHVNVQLARIQYLQRADYAPLWTEQHEAIFNALQARDLERLLEAITLHVGTAAETLVEAPERAEVEPLGRTPKVTAAPAALVGAAPAGTR